MTRIFVLLMFFPLMCLAQTKAGGVVVDESGSPIAFANVIFKNSSEGTITNDNGRFYIESDATYDALVVSYIGYETTEIPLPQKVNYDLEIVLSEAAEQLQEVIVYTGKQSKKNINPTQKVMMDGCCAPF